MSPDLLELAACRTHPEIEWVPSSKIRGGVDRTYHANLAAARLVCASCPVRGVCLDEAIREHHVGIWAGTTVLQRRRVRRGWLGLEARESQKLAALEREAR